MGHKSTTKTVVEKQDTQQHSWVMDIPGLQDLGRRAVANSAAIPDYNKVNMNQQQIDTLNEIYKGQDYSNLKIGADFFDDISRELTNQGQQYAESGSSAINSGLSTVARISNMGVQDYNDLISKYTDNDLVSRQKAASTEDINEELDRQVQELNHRAISAGAMGSSRAGVAQGVLGGKAMQSIQRSNLDIDTQARKEALGMVQFQLGNEQNAANTFLNYGQNAVSTGLSAINSGMNAQNNSLNWNAQYQQGQMTNLNNRWMVGSINQQEAQNQADIDRINQMMRDNPDLYRWMQMTGAMAPAAGWSTMGTTNTNSKTTQSTRGGGMGALMGIAGAAVGGFFGGPAGAAVGASVGSQAGNAM